MNNPADLPALSDKQKIKARQIEERLLINPFQPLLWSLISKELFFFNPKEGEVIRRYLENAGEIIPVGEDLFFHVDAVNEAKKLVGEYIACHGKITVGEARDLLGSSRKFVVPLLEYFDAVGFTERKGNVRVLARSIK